MARYGMVIDLDKCVGCQACSLACKSENNVPFGSPGEQKRRVDIYWHKVIAASEGKYPTQSMEMIPMPCMHCDHPPCVNVCPVKATYKREDGIVMQNTRRCIGCRYCIIACPYGVRNFNDKAQEETPYQRADLPEDMGLDGDKFYGPWPFPHRTRGVVEKCTYCFHRISAAEKQIEEGEDVVIGSDRPDGVVPAYVEACPTGARFFGDLDNPDSVVSQLMATRDPFVLKEAQGTNPKTIYLPR